MPILNHRDYRIAVTRVAQLERATARRAVIETLKDGLPAELTETRLATIKTELVRLRTELAAYRELRGASPDAPGGIESDEMGLLPILARISRQLSQKQLAELLGLKEQQIQRYERQRYATISLERYQQVLAALGVEVQPRLLPKHSASAQGEQLDIELKPELLRELRRRAWLDLPRSMPPSEMRAKLHAYVTDGRKLAGGGALNRRSKLRSADSGGILELWRGRVLRIASERRGQLKGKFNIADTAWLGDLVRLSAFPDGPVRAASMLKEHGIILVIEPHLPTTMLDGAALLLSGGIPVVALTLRHDRLDNFWFTLLHELAHVFLHFNCGLEAGFIDDDLQDVHVSDREQEADDFARNRLISDEVWRSSVARFSKSQDVVEKFARSLGVHPAIVAGRIRSERDYTLFSQLVGSGQLRKLFADSAIWSG